MVSLWPGSNVWEKSHGRGQDIHDVRDVMFVPGVWTRVMLYPPHWKWHYKYFLWIEMQIKGLYLSKALTCMKIFLYKQELHFCQGDGYFWPHCCMNNLYISHRSLYAPTYNFWAIRSMLISLFRVTSWFDTVNNAVTRWMNFRENNLLEHDLQLFDYNI